MRALVLALVLLGGCALKTPPAREDIAKLEATLSELTECRRLLDEINAGFGTSGGSFDDIGSDLDIDGDDKK